jgi:hypothetical protein
MRRSLSLLALVGAVATAYRRIFHPWQERWGARDEDLVASLPGDDLIAEPAGQVTRAIEIAAPPEAVWPWVIQLGADRGGFYSYDRLENLFRLGIHSADRIVPKWQERAVGDLVHADAKGDNGWYVMDARPPHALVLEMANVKAGRPFRRDEPPYMEFTWAFVLQAHGESRTRLLVRERVAFGKRLAEVFGSPVGLISFVMTQKMMRGIKSRAETPTQTARPY